MKEWFKAHAFKLLCLAVFAFAVSAYIDHLDAKNDMEARALERELDMQEESQARRDCLEIYKAESENKSYVLSWGLTEYGKNCYVEYSGTSGNTWKKNF